MTCEEMQKHVQQMTIETAKARHAELYEKAVGTIPMPSMLSPEEQCEYEVLQKRLGFWVEPPPRGTHI